MGNGTVTSKFRFYPKDSVKSMSQDLEVPNIRFYTEPIKSNESDIRNDPKPLLIPSAKSKENDQAPRPTLVSPVPAKEPEPSQNQPSTGETDKTPIEFPSTHHSSNCIRCYRLKKKCSRTYPRCSNCSKSGSICEYVNRQQKRKISHTSKETESPVEEKKSQILRIVSENPAGKEKAHVVAHKLVTISSLLANEEKQEEGRSQHEQSASEEKSVRFDQITVSQDIDEFNAKHQTERETCSKGRKIANLLNNKTWPIDNSQTDTKDDFVTIKTIENEELPMAFITTYFQNYEHIYPFIDREKFVTNFKKIDFKNEAIINLDVYLLMCIGCLINDSSNQQKYFQEYFNDKIIESIINILHFNNLENDINLESINLLLLICIYGLNLFNVELCWAAVGILNRLVVRLEYYKPQATLSTLKERYFWSIYNIDKELSLLLEKPSQLPHDDFISLPFPLTGKLNSNEENDRFLQLVNSQISLHKLHDGVLSLKLNTKSKASPEKLKRLSSDLEKWRVTTSLVIHTEYSGSPHLQESIGFVNFNYYYLLIELDQISSTESFQFTLQFLSCSFSLLLSTTSRDSENKIKIKISLHLLFWYKKLFKVIGYNLDSLHKILGEPNSRLNVSEFNANLQLMTNLLRYLSNSDTKPPVYSNTLALAVTLLDGISVKLVNYGAETSSGKDGLLNEILELKQLLHQ